MKKIPALAAAMASLALTGTLSGCSNQQDLYGPPPTRDGADIGYTETDYDPENNVVEDVYGPPPAEEETEETEISSLPDWTATQFRPEESTAAPLYGPPPTEKAVE